jgi:hypothetical protein
VAALNFLGDSMTTDPRERANTDARAFALEIARAFLSELTDFLSAKAPPIQQLPPLGTYLATDMNLPPPTARDVQRFWSYVRKDSASGCWPWQGHRSKQGYGMFCLAGRTVRAHRYSFFLNNGRIPPGLFVLHSCDNPVCVNPSHLRIGTARENSMDIAKRRRQPYGEKHHLARLTEADVRSVRQSSASSVALGKQFGVSSRAILNIRHGRTWKSVDASTAIEPPSGTPTSTSPAQTPAAPEQP